LAVGLTPAGQAEAWWDCGWSASAPQIRFEYQTVTRCRSESAIVKEQVPVDTCMQVPYQVQAGGR
jgi:hypothetical protein